jgi:hypothetical protein
MEDEIDLSSITDMYHRTESRHENYDDNSATLQDTNNEEDAESEYSDPTPVNPSPRGNSNAITEDEGPPTPRGPCPVQTAPNLDSVEEKHVSLPEFSSFLSNNDFGISLQSYMTPSPPPVPAKDVPEKEAPSIPESQEHLQRPSTPEASSRYLSRPEYDGSGWGPEEDEYEVGTPESVIRHPMPLEPSPPRESPSIPEQVATIKSASGSKLKTRPSATPSDLIAMREARRQISGEMPSVPPIPERHRNRPSLNLDQSENDQGVESEEGLERQLSFKRSLTLDIGDDLGSSLSKDFDRVIEAQKVAFNLSTLHTPLPHNDAGQVSTSSDNGHFGLNANIAPRKQRGYLMRQNTKLVIASSDVDRGTRSAGNSPVKKERPQSWTVEPWNGQPRKKSARESMSPRKKVPSGPVPPMPGHDSNVAGLGILTEEEPTTADPNTSDGGERGRLFVKVIGVKDLDLPLPKSRFVLALARIKLTNFR